MTLHFVVPPGYANELRELPRQVIGKDYPYWLTGHYNWAALTYLVLRQYREGLTIGVTPEANRINFAHSMTWRNLGARHGEFRISARADYPRLFDVDFEILQNPAVPLKERQAYLPYWPVPGIIPRNLARKGVTNIAYAGFIGPLNLAAELRQKSDLFRGCSFRIVPPQLWHDMSDIDVLVAIRSLDRRPHEAKPPSKLFAAWLSNVPLIAGWDSAFSSIGKPGVDYIRVENETGFGEALERLATDSSYYDAIVSAGRAMAPEVSQEAIAQFWLACFDGPIAAAFAEHTPPYRNRGRRFCNRQIDRLRNSASTLRAALRRK